MLFSRNLKTKKNVLRRFSSRLETNSPRRFQDVFKTFFGFQDVFSKSQVDLQVDLRRIYQIFLKIKEKKGKKCVKKNRLKTNWLILKIVLENVLEKTWPNIFLDIWKKISRFARKTKGFRYQNFLKKVPRRFFFD